MCYLQTCGQVREPRHGEAFRDWEHGEAILTSQTRGQINNWWDPSVKEKGRRLNHRTQSLSDQRPVIRWWGQGRINTPASLFSQQLICQCRPLDKGSQWKAKIPMLRLMGPKPNREGQEMGVRRHSRKIENSQHTHQATAEEVSRTLCKSVHTMFSAILFIDVRHWK